MSKKKTPKKPKKNPYRLPLLLTLLVAAIAAFVLSCATTHTHARTEDLFRKVSQSTVLVSTDIGTGSGTVVGEKLGGALTLTCEHVLPKESGPSIYVTAPGGEKWMSVVVRSDPKLDLALLWSPGFSAPIIKLAEQDPELYDEVYIVASPHGFGGSASTGWLSNKDSTLDFGPGEPRTGAHVWSITAAFTFAGVSGGSVFNRDGELACVPEAGSMKMYPVRPFGVVGIQLPQISFCIPVSDVRKFMEAK